jgi:hypothetical protein
MYVSEHMLRASAASALRKMSSPYSRVSCAVSNDAQRDDDDEGEEDDVVVFVGKWWWVVGQRPTDAMLTTSSVVRFRTIPAGDIVCIDRAMMMAECGTVRRALEAITSEEEEGVILDCCCTVSMLADLVRFFRDNRLPPLDFADRTPALLRACVELDALRMLEALTADVLTFVDDNSPEEIRRAWGLAADGGYGPAELGWMLPLDDVWQRRGGGPSKKK